MRSLCVLAVFLTATLLFCTAGFAFGQEPASEQAQSDAEQTASEPAPEAEAAEPSETSDESEEQGAEQTETPPEQAGKEEAEPAAPAKSGPVADAEAWADRVEKLAKNILLGEAGREDADNLYFELDKALEDAVAALRQSLASDAAPEEVTARYDAMEILYAARLRLLEEVRPILLVKITGLGADGVRELQDELERLELHYRYKARDVPSRASRFGSDLRTSPVPLITGLFKIFIAIMIFRWWRGFAGRTIPKMRQDLLGAKPRRRRNIRLAKTLWYFDEIRSPLEWLVLLSVIVSIIRPEESLVTGDPVWKTIKWVFVGWMAFRLVNAIAQRGGAGMARDSSGLRLRSLKMISIWFVAFFLSRDLASGIVGDGTIYSWVTWVVLVLGFPVLIILLVWWREEVFRRLAKDPHPPHLIQRLVAKGKTKKTLVGTAIGGIYLLAQGTRRRILQWISRSEMGRRALAYAFRKEVARQAEAERRAPSGEPLADEVRQRLVNGEKLVEKVHRSRLKQLVELAKDGRGRSAIIVGERGSGKTTMLRRLSEQLDEEVVVIDCPKEGFDALKEALRKALDIETSWETLEEAHRAIAASPINVIAIDNIHRLTRPVIGGLEGLDLLIELARRAGSSMSWVGTADTAGWQYITRARPNRTFMDTQVKLKPWDEAELGPLITSRSKEAGIDPDFDKLVLPRQLDDMIYEHEEQRKQAGFLRLLWDASDGNPEVALRLWCDSIRVDKRGKMMVHLFPQRDPEQLEELNLTGRFVLRSVMQMEFARHEDVREALQMAQADVETAIRYCISQDLLQEEESWLRVTWPWFRSITRMLARKNLLVAN